MPPEPFNSEDWITSIAETMQYAFVSCESLREIHFPTLESIIFDDKNDSNNLEVTDSFKDMLNLAVEKVLTSENI